MRALGELTPGAVGPAQPGRADPGVNDQGRRPAPAAEDVFFVSHHVETGRLARSRGANFRRDLEQDKLRRWLAGRLDARRERLDERRRPRGSEHGSVLMLVPALVLVLVVLAAIAVDSAVIFLGQRQLGDAAAAAANDAASALSDPSFYRAGSVALDPSVARRVAQASVATQDHSGVTIDGPADVQVEGRQVCVSLTGHVEAIFGRAIPGVPHATTVRARATATAAGDRGTTVQHRSLC